MWPLAETLAVAQLAFQGLNVNPEREHEANDDGMFVSSFCSEFCVQTTQCAAMKLVTPRVAYSTERVHCRVFVPWATIRSVQDKHF